MKDLIEHEMFIRPAKKEDVFVITQIYLDIWKNEYKDFIAKEYLDTLRESIIKVVFENRILNETNPCYAFVALIKNEVIGFVFAKRNVFTIYDVDGEIDKLYIRKDYRGKGISKKLLYVALQALKDHNFTKVLLWTFEDGQSKTFYEHLKGKVFRRVGVNYGKKKLMVLGFMWSIDAFLLALEEPLL
jgi:GNAT superfamily N-acetyltransferase